MTIDKSKIALVHVAKSRLKLTNEDYRSILEGLGVESSKDLTMDGFKRLMFTFKKMGFESSAYQGRKHYKKQPGQVWGCSPSQRALIEHLWYEKARNKNNDSLEKFIFRIVHKSSAFLTHQDVEKVVNAIKNMKGS